MGEIVEGVYAATLTPMFEDFSCDHQTLAAHCARLVEAGCTGITLFGTTGEGASFSLGEKIEALDELVSHGFPAKKIIVGSLALSFKDTVALARAALKHGCSALMIAPPSYYKNISDEGLLAFYQRIIEEVADPDFRIILYHFPKLSGVPITLKLIEQLREKYPSIVVALKESDGDFSLVQSAIENFSGFKVFVGNERQIAAAVRLGGAGTISGVANLYPELVCSLYKQGNQMALDPFFQALKQHPFIASAKALMAQRHGKAWATLRPPLAPLSAKDRQSFLKALES
jgi:4-hydroxy-tetrahydrodipicolinate synthase